ncbi:UDP-glycosyltransferase 86A2-like [Silene latifolia]|uniref:UDP-glycosyltransferase 86A2-like n=1 Tax=Silene latifolia TaxID=37657 RepID=UPI003D779C61
MENPNTKIMNTKPHAILVAYPLQGHINPSVQLAIKLASKGFSLTFINTQSIHHHITSSNPVNDPNHFFFGPTNGSNLDIEYMTVSDGLPIDYDRSLNHEHWFGAMMHTYPAHVEVAVREIVKSRPSTCCVIADATSTWASKVANKFGLYYVSFWTEAALVLNIYSHVDLLRENGHIAPGTRKDEIDYIPGVTSLKTTDLMSYFQDEDMTSIVHQCIFEAIKDARQSDFILGNTVQELEPHATLVVQAQIPFYPIGPLFPHGLDKGSTAMSLWAKQDCTQWLDTKPHGSVLYVSFGSYAHISKEELEEIANGIKLSGVNFIWVIRPDMVSSDDPDPLPIEFRNEVQDRGIIVTWTNQIAVLSHPAVGGFLTHCGWNSTLESIWHEVPLLCFPLLSDQFTNRKLIVDDWKVGYNLCEETPVKKEEISHKIKLLICESSGTKFKERINKIKKLLESAITSDGSSEKNFDSFVNDLKIGTKKKLCFSLDS